MEQNKPFTILFTYEIAEDAIKFQLQADVTVMKDGIYLVSNIRHTGKADGSLIPPISLRRENANWIYTDSKKETALSLAVGHAIDNQVDNRSRN